MYSIMHQGNVFLESTVGYKLNVTYFTHLLLTVYLIATDGKI